MKLKISMKDKTLIALQAAVKIANCRYQAILNVDFQYYYYYSFLTRKQNMHTILYMV